jgi:hypothetical protein
MKTKGIRLLFLVAMAGMIAATSACLLDSRHDFTELKGTLDLTNDLHHRMKAGIFVPGKEPVTFLLMSGNPGVPDPSPHQYMRIATEAGSLWVKADKRGRVNVYMNNDVIFSHPKISGSNRILGVQRDFFESPQHPIKPAYFINNKGQLKQGAGE